MDIKKPSFWDGLVEYRITVIIVNVIPTQRWITKIIHLVDKTKKTYTFLCRSSKIKKHYEPILIIEIEYSTLLSVSICCVPLNLFCE